jgi:hypothetical protein
MIDWKKVKKYELGPVVEGKRKVTMLLEGNDTEINRDLPYDLWYDDESNILKISDGKPKAEKPIPTKMPKRLVTYTDPQLKRLTK